MEEDFLPEIAQMPWLVVNSVLLLGGEECSTGSAEVPLSSQARLSTHQGGLIRSPL